MPDWFWEFVFCPACLLPKIHPAHWLICKGEW